MKLFVLGVLLLPLSLCAQSDPVLQLKLDEPEPLHPGQHVSLSYVASESMEQFTAPDLSSFELLTGMAKNEGLTSTLEKGVRTQRSYSSRSWTLVVPRADSVLFPGAEAVVGGVRCVCPPRWVRIVRVEVDTAGVRYSVEVLPENPEPGKPFGVSVWLNQKPDQARPAIDLSAYGSKLRVLSTGMSRRSELLEYSWTLMAWMAGEYRIPPMTVHFGGTPFQIEGVTIQVGQPQK